MEQDVINLEEKSLIELKAMAYDFGLLINQYKEYLDIVNQNIVARTRSRAGAASSETATGK